MKGLINDNAYYIRERQLQQKIVIIRLWQYIMGKKIYIKVLTDCQCTVYSLSVWQACSVKFP